MTFTELFNLIESYVAPTDLAIYELIIVGVIVVMFAGWYYSHHDIYTTYFD